MFDRATTFGEALEDPAARSILERYMPGIAASPMATQFRGGRLGQLVALVPALEDLAERERFFAALAEVGDGAPRPPYDPAIAPDPAYEPDDVARGSAPATLPGPTPLWEPLELRFAGPSHGNPFVDVELEAVFTRDSGQVRVGGFYDGDGVYVVRALADTEGPWSFQTRSTARSLDGITGTVEVVAARDGAHGPVQVDGFHFRHADGTRHRPLGTTAYAWTHQPEALQQQTLATLADAPFAKLRMCVFPKSYLYNADEPDDFPFVGSLAEGFDLTRFDPAHFRRLEQRVAELGALGIEADIILFHAYDRWGFADLGPAVDERYLRHVVRRLAGFANVWWSMANEYDLLWSKDIDDWERLAAVVGEEDPFGHLNSIHNCRPVYDYAKPWITHVSIQRVDVYRTAENTDQWREQWGKPVVIDECAYEGDIDQGWGNITGEEMVRRFWEGAVRGGYVGHGETYYPPALGLEGEVLWWSKGGVLHGTSPDRIRFLEQLQSEAPEGVWDPLPSDWDMPWGGAEGQVKVGYFGFNRPRFRNLILDDGGWRIEVIDTWGMTVETLPGVQRGQVRVELPGRQFMALRLTRLED
ncbi:DUF5605 domain-containing protein [uncultured Microbacterium sp.]|uniref:DUF5060 domain-containing protein n=1 Tax=uncultured Microbacterium sp. TaxID=191216 RepID=A0A1Y5P8A5_9MICO|nr:DUF5605 domain-containing protein [uncultured Microbacterium sp.]SBS72311.1 conserved hypothetical protein [uncultured Microbacterium sp.]